jgi:methionyl aminopeptidase
MIVLKSAAEIAVMRLAGRIVAEVLAEMRERVKPGVTTLELDEIAERIIRQHGATPSFKGKAHGDPGAPPFPASICTSVNEEIVHGIPSSRRLKEGDIIAVDVGAYYNTAEPQGFSVVREYTSHGVGRELHEGFSLLNYGTAGHGMVLRPGLTIAVEPMINAGKYGTKVKKDKWTVVTIDGKLSAHFEHTIAITEGDAEVLTKLD